MSAERPADLPRRLVAEALGTCLLLACVLGSGIMAERLAGGNVAMALLGNTIPTGAILVVLITVLGPISGAHLNPAVSLVAALRRELPYATFMAYVGAQIAGGVLGAGLAHLMFELPVVMWGVKPRGGVGQWVGEVTATFGLVPNDIVQKTLYVGALFSTSVIMAVLGLYVLRHPELHRIPPQRLRSGILAEVIASVVFAITFVVAVAFPAIGYWSMVLLVLVGPVHAVLDRSLLRPAGR